MNNETSNCFHKTVIITRAVSGSGKTTLVRCIIDGLKQHGLTVGSHSTDDYFMKDGKYVFDKEKLSENHARNLAEFKNDIKAGLDVVICDNMNLLPWQPQPYTEAARKHRYRIIYLNLLPRTLEEHLAAQAVTDEKPDAHGLTKDLLERFIREFNDYNDLLDKNTIRDPKRHQVFVWNDFDKVAVPTGDIAPYFDCDDVITIRPENYHSVKETIASDVLNKLTITSVSSDTNAKKHYLLTWYGITDLRSALKLESGGPISNALQTGKYTDVIILCHTSPNKNIDHTTQNLQDECEKLYNSTFEDNRSYPPKDAKSLIDAVCNTDYAHRLFLDFIESLNLPINVHHKAWRLSHLNDAKGIYNGIKWAIKEASKDPEDKTLTCYLSPGTPLMAYTWATVSKENPHLRLRIIASSNSSKPPEEIILPNIQTLPVSSDTPTLPDDFDVMIHLLGTDTNLPQCFTMLQYPVKTQYIIKSNAAPKKLIKAFGHFLPKDSNITQRDVDPFNVNHTCNAVESIVASLPKSTKIGVNVTGGTKLMFAGAIKACSKFANVEPIYFEVKEHMFKFIKQNTQTAFKGVPSVESFFLANGFSVADKGCWQDNPNRDGRRELTKALWENRNKIAGIYGNNKSFNTYRSQADKALKNKQSIDGISLNIEQSKISIKYDGFGEAEITLNGQLFESQFAPDDFFHYITGGWLEEFAYMHYESRLKAGEIKDLRIGFKINTPNPDKNEKKSGNTNPHNIYGEFDCVYTDGKRLFIVECKAGTLKQEHIQKLENNVRNYGGREAKGELFLSLKTNQNNIRRIENSTFVSIPQFCFRENDKKKNTDSVTH